MDNTTPTAPTIHISLAALPGLRTIEAAQAAIAGGGLSEPLFGALSAAHVQIVPQNYGVVDEAVCDWLRTLFPGTRFRLHANARVLARHEVADLSGWELHETWFRRAAEISRRLDAPAYSAHAGLRSEASLSKMLDHTRHAADLFGCPVAVEGHYPSRGSKYLVENWSEYRTVFESGVPYVVDLSHLNIVAHQSGAVERELVRDMLACERCIEVHVSDNDGRGDSHRVCRDAPWWFALLADVNPGAVVFSEGNHRHAGL